MVTCHECGLNFENKKVYANHVRWKHRIPFTEEGKKRSYDAWHKRKDRITENVTCPRCGDIFERTYIAEHPEKAKKFCSSKCAHARPQLEVSKRKTSMSMSAYLKSHPSCAARFIQSTRRSSKAERELALRLGHEQFRRHLVVKSDEISFDIDIVTRDANVWIESDGSWHFRQVHKRHDFAMTRRRDKIEEQEALKQRKLLIRINNEQFTIDEQLKFIHYWISRWSSSSGGLIVKLYQASDVPNYESDVP